VISGVAADNVPDAWARSTVLRHFHFEEQPMRKWLVPLIVLSAGGIGAYLFTGRRRDTLRGWLAELFENPKQWQDWNETAVAELDHIQQALSQIAQTLEPQHRAEHP
jgi:hypothetical protein